MRARDDVLVIGGGLIGLATAYKLMLAQPGLVVRVLEKGQTYNVGIMFTKISKKHEMQISQMAQDHYDCETRIGLKLPDACVPNCHFAALCAKPQKLPPVKAAR